MAQWPVEPVWKDPSTINNGNQFEPTDGLLYSDLNKIVEDILYLRSIMGQAGLGPIEIIDVESLPEAAQSSPSVVRLDNQVYILTEEAE